MIFRAPRCEFKKIRYIWSAEPVQRNRVAARPKHPLRARLKHPAQEISNVKILKVGLRLSTSFVDRWQLVFCPRARPDWNVRRAQYRLTTAHRALVAGGTEADRPSVQRGPPPS